MVTVDRLPVKFLERYRAEVGHGFSPVRPYRDPSHKRAVKGAPCSWHTDACGHEAGAPPTSRPS